MLIQFSVFPFTKGLSIRAHVAKALEELDKAGLPYRVTDMGTIVEGEWETLMPALKRIHDRLLSDTERVYMTLSLDSRRDKKVPLGAKVLAVESQLGKKLS